ncbi:MAG: bifunctional diguanylate cyclase/phosphodiesterase, partial [Motiliproteus sp.]|nr:bifunctional diguanylate cyclase/phosphodiesterase [Motiliproteus sp.]
PDFPVLGDLLLSRLGGDEFVMLLPAYRHKKEVENLCRLIRDRLEEGFVIDEHRFHISASLGVTFYPDNAGSAQELLKQADIAMYAVKNSGRRGYQLYHREMDTEVNRDIALIQQFRIALEQDQLYLDYQPIHDLSNGSLVGAEALLRWQHPERGLIPPDDFVPVIEKTELITPLTLWVLNQACNDLSSHILFHHPRFNLSVNISGAALEDESIREKVSQIIKFYNLPERQLHLEITETSMMENVESCADILYEWKNAGTDIWIDDFGTGYSSLNYLHNLPIDGLKVDRSFISSISTDQQSQIIETIVALGSSLEIKTIAEGIETEIQRQRLQAMGCRYGQGNLFSRPLPLRPLIRKFNQKIVNA